MSPVPVSHAKQPPSAPALRLAPALVAQRGCGQSGSGMAQAKGAGRGLPALIPTQDGPPGRHRPTSTSHWPVKPHGERIWPWGSC